MPITVADVEQALAAEPVAVPASYSDRDTKLYAVAIGMGKDPMDQQALQYTCETVGERVVPSAATVLSRNAARQADPLRSKMDYSMLLHGEQSLTLHQPLPVAAEILVSNRTTGVYDKGAGKGALVVNETDVTLTDGTPLYTLGSTSFYRGDGGFGGTAEGAPVPHRLPERAPDHVCELPQRPEQALIYALCGDRNPLHRDPAAAQKAGFDMPILHGLCSYGIACHAVLATVLDYDHARMKSFDLRFSAPVFPGETQLVEMWVDGDIVSFRTRIKERDVVSINNGKCVITA